jgi:hypothetical protein
MIRTPVLVDDMPVVLLGEELVVVLQNLSLLQVEIVVE